MIYVKILVRVFENFTLVSKEKKNYHVSKQYNIYVPLNYW